MSTTNASTTPKSTAIYCRLAHKDNERLQEQKERLLQFAQAHGHDNVSVYADNGESGLNLNCPSFLKLNEDISKGKINAVIIQSISRIGRNYIATSQWLNSMTEKGINVKAVDGSVGHTDNEGFDILKAFARYSRKNIKKGGVQHG